PRDRPGLQQVDPVLQPGELGAAEDYPGRERVVGRLDHGPEVEDRQSEERRQHEQPGPHPIGIGHAARTSSPPWSRVRRRAWISRLRPYPPSSASIVLFCSSISAVPSSSRGSPAWILGTMALLACIQAWVFAGTL